MSANRIMNYEEQHQRIQELEKAIRILQKKLDRSERERQQLESDISTKEFLLKQVINQLQDSQQHLEQKSHDLQTTLSNLQAMQLQLIQNEKMSALGQTVAGIAHEINNPISFIYGNLSHLTEYIQDLLHLIHLYHHYLPMLPTEIVQERDKIDIAWIEQDAPMILQSMDQGAQRIRDVVLALRNFSRLDEVGYKAIDLHAGLDNTLMILQQKLAQIQVIQDHGELPLVTCVAGDLNQVFMNILNNAIDTIVQRRTEATPSTLFIGKITIRTQCQLNQQVQIWITDNGMGIPPEIIDKVFDPFFTTKAIGQGAGLGLAIAHQIIEEDHGGTIEVESTLGEGSTFIITLPIQSP
ncbi:MAG: ATP-binding protein [Synechococcales bacterium]|nr:ATP-binding protein [Synechococcales bacterium]